MARSTDGIEAELRHLSNEQGAYLEDCNHGAAEEVEMQIYNLILELEELEKHA